jgi:hypothetical protein
MSNAQLANRIGTMVRCNRVETPDYIHQILPHGFESLQLMWWQHARHDLPRLAAQVREAIGDADVTIPTLAMFGNPLEHRTDRDPPAGSN